MLSLDALQKIDGAEDRPPAVAGEFEKMPAPQPLFLSDGGRIAAEAAGLGLEAEQLQQILEAAHAEILSAPGKSRVASGQAPPDAPQAERIEAGNQHLPFGNQHALDLAQDLVRVVRKLQRVRKRDQVDAAARQGQMMRIAEQRRRRGRIVHKAQRHAIGAQAVALRQADLHGVVAKDVGHHLVEASLFPLEDVPPLRGQQPLVATGN